MTVQVCPTAEKNPAERLDFFVMKFRLLSPTNLKNLSSNRSATEKHFLFDAKNFIKISETIPKIRKIYYLCFRSIKDHAVVVELVDTLA